MTRKELKMAAKDQLRGNWAWAVGLSFFAWFIVYLVNDIQSFIENGHDTVYNVFYQIGNGVQEDIVEPVGGLIGFVISILAGVLFWGVTYTILQFRDKGDKPNIFSGMFSAYRGDRFTSSFLTFLCQYIFTILWTLLFIIPGIVKSFSYAMTPYIMKDLYDAGKKPTATEAITMSRRLMDGHKTELFVLYLSFIGWWLLSIITLGIGFLWLVPYYRQTIANFYRNLAGEQFLKKD